MSNIRNILITGATSGIGYQAAVKLINLGHRLIILCRDQNKLSKTLSSFSREPEFEKDFYKQIDFKIADLSNLSTLNKLMEELLSEGYEIDTLILNAGMQYTGSKDPMWSVDGHEITFAVNHLSHYYLTRKILPLLFRSTSPRIIITASEVHNPKSPGGRVGKVADIGNLEGLRSGKGFMMLDGDINFNADKAYKDSKLCNILFARELYRRLSDKGKEIPIIAWAPGLVIPKGNDGFFRYSRKYNEFGQRIFAFIARDLLSITETPKNAGELLSKLSVDSEYNQKGFSYISNKILRPGTKSFQEEKVSLQASSDILARDLWELTSEILKIKSEI
ncbi:SDR family NAD(P)-dependent oxidoreductase [Prochlorococcus sp. MIT 1223]|uniref:SDR family NAD(P)-dependent oxidoreductase n=1 Tax=Prochlorococcus sp. MIT 1223 TaxID=3096217 RepID=UPI002A748BAE|nr:SDR family NAD(P)-dependent oxidoreductase [Prochlorococcus sp. MIT 1223]